MAETNGGPAGRADSMPEMLTPEWWPLIGGAASAFSTAAASAAGDKGAQALIDWVKNNPVTLLPIDSHETQTHIGWTLRMKNNLGVSAYLSGLWVEKAPTARVLTLQNTPDDNPKLMGSTKSWQLAAAQPRLFDLRVGPESGPEATQTIQVEAPIQEVGQRIDMLLKARFYFLNANAPKVVESKLLVLRNRKWT